MGASREADSEKQRDSVVLLTFRLSAMWQEKSLSLRAEAFKQSSLYNDQPPFVWTQYLSSTHATSGVFCIQHLLASPDIPDSSRKQNIQATPPGLSTSGLLHVKKVVETCSVAEWTKRIFLHDKIK